MGLAAPYGKKQIKVLKDIPREFKKINRRILRRIVTEFYRDRLVDFHEKKDGSIKIVLSKEGVKRAISYKIDEMKISKPFFWDKKWRVMIFDIPEDKKRAREALRRKITELGFYQLQKSVFIFPYECHDELDFIIEFFELRRHVRIMTVSDITNEAELKLFFDLD